MSFIIFCAHGLEFLRKVFKVDQFNIVSDRNKAFLPVPEVATDSPFSNSPSFIYPAINRHQWKKQSLIISPWTQKLSFKFAERRILHQNIASKRRISIESFAFWIACRRNNFLIIRETTFVPTEG